MNKNGTKKLFSYGTLCYEAVQIAAFGRKLIGSTHVLAGYTLSQLKINNPKVIATSGDAVHPILIATDNKNDKVEAVVFDVSLKKLEMADEYEVSHYTRVSVKPESGISAWVYAAFTGNLSKN